jgi:hypothetical protein
MNRIITNTDIIFLTGSNVNRLKRNVTRKTGQQIQNKIKIRAPVGNNSRN